VELRPAVSALGPRHQSRRAASIGLLVYFYPTLNLFQLLVYFWPTPNLFQVELSSISAPPRICLRWSSRLFLPHVEYIPGVGGVFLCRCVCVCVCDMLVFLEVEHLPAISFPGPRHQSARRTASIELLVYFCPTFIYICTRAHTHAYAHMHAHI